MATKTMTLADLTAPIDQADDVQRAQRSLQEAEGRLSDLLQGDYVVNEATRAKAEQAIAVAAERVWAAREAERGRRAEAFRLMERAAVQKLRAALVSAQAANEDVKSVQLAKHEFLREPFESLGWFELSAGDDTRIGQWMKKLAEYQFD
jgi:hypothetical protein